MKKTIIMLCMSIVGLGVFAQHDHSKMDMSEMHSKKADKPSDSKSINVAKSQDVTNILTSYLSLEDALVSDNSKKAAASGKLLVQAFTKFNVTKQPETQQEELEEIIENAKEQAEHISKNSGKIDHQREHFEVLSTDIKDLIVITGSDRNFYQIYCPMYNNNKGATWLSASKDIKNPFFGSMMLKCGSVQQEIIVQ